MNRYTIEKRDKELVEKFRAVVASKERRKRMARIRLAGVLLLIACAGLMFFSKKFSQSPVPEKEMSQSNRIALNRLVDEINSQQQAEDIRVVAAEPIELSEDNQGLNPQPPFLGGQSAEPVLSEINMANDPVPVLKPRVKTSGKIGISEVSKQISAKADIQIAEIVTCQSVKNRQAVFPNNQFSLQKGANPYVWMDVRSKKTPYKLRHIYYLNSRRYCTVPLAIHYPRMRTWSNVTLRHPYEAGQWRVDVVTGKGEILSRIEFTVVP